MCMSVEMQHHTNTTKKIIEITTTSCTKTTTTITATIMVYMQKCSVPLKLQQ